MSKTTVNVDVITEVKGLQNLKKAQSEMGVLGDAAKKLGGVLAGVFAADKLVSFARDSVKAFADNQKQVALLTATLNNLGQGFRALQVNAFIDHLQLATGVSRDDLIPAFQGLFIATGDATKAQQALQLAMDVSAGTGKDLNTVQIALSKAYLGNTTSLTRLGAGLSKEILKTGDMNKITKQLALTFKGDAGVAAETFAGKMARLQVSTKEVEETIGSGLVDALAMLSGDTSIETLQSQMQGFADATANAIRGVGVLLQKINSVPIANAILGTFADVINKGPIGQLIKLGENSPAGKAAMRSRQQYGGIYADQYNAQKEQTIIKANLKIEQARAKALQDQKKAAADKLALERSSLSLKLAGSTADMQNIEIQAALQRGQTAEVNNVLLLQRAILNGNADQANILAQEVLKANGLVMDVNGNITSLAKAKDPFGDWPEASAAAMRQLLAIQAELAKIQSKTITVTVNTVYSSSSGTTASGSFTSTGDKGGAGSTTNDQTPGVTIYPSTPAFPNYGMQTTPKSTVSAIELLKTAEVTTPSLSKGGAYDKPIVINITAPANTVIDTTQDASTNGTAVTVNRTNPFGMYSAV
jgi:uncharacterized coiled-coil protein SlyX